MTLLGGEAVVLVAGWNVNSRRRDVDHRRSSFTLCTSVVQFFLTEEVLRLRLVDFGADIFDPEVQFRPHPRDVIPGGSGFHHRQAAASASTDGRSTGISVLFREVSVCVSVRSFFPDASA